MMKANWEEIKTLEDFRQIQREEEGYIVITDIANPNRVHKPSCSFVKEENFEIKVIINRCKNGNYCWANNIGFAKKQWNADPCPVCNPP